MSLSSESFLSCEESPTNEAANVKNQAGYVDAAIQSEALHIYDYYADVEGNLYHKNDLTGKLIKEMNLVDAKYLFDKYVLKQTEAETTVPFTQAEDKLVKAGAKICNNDFEMIKNRLFRISSKTTEQIRNRFYMLTKE